MDKKNKIYFVEPSKAITGKIKIPGDKSISHRAALLAALAHGQSSIENFLPGEDNLATLQILQQLGVHHHFATATTVLIEGTHQLQAPLQALDFKNAGTSMRLSAGILAAQNFSSTLIGDASLSRRPMQRIIEPLQRMGAQITAQQNNFPPLNIRGNVNLQAIDYHLPIASAQIKSCLLLAGLFANGITRIHEPLATRDHTERLLQYLDYPCQINPSSDCHFPPSGKTICLPGKQTLNAKTIRVPGDFSSAAFFIVAACITPGSDLHLCQVGMNPTRIGLLHILKLMGANIEASNETQLGHEPVADLRIRYARLTGITIPSAWVATAIDEFPALFIACAYAQGASILRGAAELRVKESDRLQSMAEGLKTLGIEVETFPDGIKITGGEVQGGTVDSHDDHRISMAFAIAGCHAKSMIKIKNCANVATSFPNFLPLAQQIGVAVAEE